MTTASTRAQQQRHRACRDGSDDKTAGDADSSNQFWTGTNGSRRSSHSGALGWSSASSGRLDVTFGGTVVNA
ncbi:hypothetical protein AB0D38_14480 [Streptomyces sp. NPDC048279]|uniref:hypothetical protein n=1 Tax=Streptomyces sp. NPDC048279 TaxID=3154714 RepID=UPI00342808C0